LLKERTTAKKSMLRSGGRFKKYEKPLLRKHTELTFPRDILEKFNGDRFCIQCSSCHGCR
jgi:hypothetical protein